MVSSTRVTCPRSSFSSRTRSLSRTHGSQASPSTKLTPGASCWARSSTAGSSSTTTTWCPRSCRSNARCRPMLPAPATTILIDSLRHRLQQQVELVGGVFVHHEVSHVALLERGVALRDEPGSPSLHPDHLDLTIGLDG